MKPWLKRHEDLVTPRKELRPFKFWDGEGVHHAHRSDMSYVLFGTSEGISIESEQLSSLEVLQFIVENGQDNSINVAFGFGFDVDQILRDIPTEELQTLLKSGEITYHDFVISWIPGKIFTVRKRGKGWKTVKICDTLSFFQMPMIDACKEYVPGHPLIAKVEAGKDKRATFTYADIKFIRQYFAMEQELACDLMDALRLSFLGAKLSLTSWHGPGAVASALFRRERIASHIVESRALMPEAVTNATAYGYFGGRFEQFQLGYIRGPIYSYDIRSAYVAALANLPSALGEWHHEYSPKRVEPYGLYRTYWDYSDEPPAAALSMGPLPIRLDTGVVSYALSGTGWHYGNEIIAAQSAGYEIEILEGWTVDGGSMRPFRFLEEIYLQRRDWKRAGNPAQFAAKISMNCVYGKLAQLVGWDEKTGEPPKYHQQWYAGHITAYCRAQIMHAIKQNPEAIISVETDGIYSTAPLDLRIGDHLGEWEATVYDEGIFVQSGVYFLRKDSEWSTAKVRGLGKGLLTVEAAFAALETLEPLTSYVTRYGALTGHMNSEHWHCWYEQKREISWGGGGKRAHFPPICPGCMEGLTHHRSIMTVPHAGASHPRKIPWLDASGIEWEGVHSE